MSRRGQSSSVSERNSARRRTALVTGASGGIGLALAREFARGGCDLVLAARHADVLEEAASELRETTGVTVTTRAIDLSTGAGPFDLFRKVGGEGIRIDVLVNNAGTGDHGTFVEGDVDRQRAMLELNVVALTTLTRLLLEPMVARGSGRILNVRSGRGGYLRSRGPSGPPRSGISGREWCSAIARDPVFKAVAICGAVAARSEDRCVIAHMGCSVAFRSTASPPIWVGVRVTVAQCPGRTLGGMGQGLCKSVPSFVPSQGLRPHAISLPRRIGLICPIRP